MDGSDTSTARQDLDRRLTSAMAAAQGGDRAAYNIVLRESVPVIRRVARNKGAAADFLDDVVQDVLVTIHGARQTFDPSRSFVAWLTVITQRRTIDLLRKRGRVGGREVHAPIAYETHAAQDDPGHDLVRQNEAERLREAIATLPAGQREAAETLALQDISLEDASKSTGKTKTALKVNLHRAIATLRQRMTGQSGWEGRGGNDEDSR